MLAVAWIVLPAVADSAGERREFEGYTLQPPARRYRPVQMHRVTSLTRLPEVHEASPYETDTDFSAPGSDALESLHVEAPAARGGGTSRRKRDADKKTIMDQMMDVVDPESERSVLDLSGDSGDNSGVFSNPESEDDDTQDNPDRDINRELDVEHTIELIPGAGVAKAVDLSPWRVQSIRGVEEVARERRSMAERAQGDSPAGLYPSVAGEMAAWTPARDLDNPARAGGPLGRGVDNAASGIGASDSGFRTWSLSPGSESGGGLLGDGGIPLRSRSLVPEPFTRGDPLGNRPFGGGGIGPIEKPEPEFQLRQPKSIYNYRD